MKFVRLPLTPFIVMAPLTPPTGKIFELREKYKMPNLIASEIEDVAPMRNPDGSRPK